ncbi:MAG TPA: hypothetical protein VEC17_02405, partial [Candidatus Binatia bacterium]|nr:hypothetical protein [Candidatus Binatia bacterium]
GIIEGMDIDNNSWSHTIRGGSNVLGNATHSVIQNTNVTGNVVADSISNCSIGGSATYDTRSSCTVSGAVTTPNPNTFTAPAVLPLPIDETQIDAWEAEASAGGTIGTQSFNSGTRTLGPVKINGDLILTNDAQVIITGTIWVTGNITLSQTSIIRLSSGYGGLSGVIIAGVDESPTTGTITIGQSTQALGSGTAGSYLMLLSQKEGVATIAISTSQSSGSAILYAGEGMIEVSQSGSLKEITAEKLRITNSATVTYETGLANTNFTSGPGGGWEIQDQTWQLLQ